MFFPIRKRYNNSQIKNADLFNTENNSSSVFLYLRINRWIEPYKPYFPTLR